ncbi:MAG: hypothetical protein HKL99_14240 [Burkholderiales bacterium]|nr:hypothetical protein [Burkholderiales bacterium]
MAVNQAIGPQDRDRVSTTIIRPDTRRLGQKIGDVMADPRHLGVTFIVFAVATIAIPWLWLFTALVGAAFIAFYWGRSGREALPMRMPSTDGETDYGDPMPGSGRGKYFKAAGIAHLGNDASDNAQLWLSKRDLLTHILIFGSTGSGKTEVIVSILANFLLLSSGFMDVDPKAAPKLAFQIYSMCRMFWRDHDFRVMNYMTTVKRSPNGFVHPRRNSNTSNPVNRGSPESCTSILTSLIAASKGDNAIFGMNAQNMMSGLMRGLVELRDEHRRPLDVSVIRDSLGAKAYIELATNAPLRPATKNSMMAFLRSVGYVEGNPFEKQPPSFTQQYGYSNAYYSQPLNSLTDSYGYIFARAAQGEVDFEDIIKQRRILVVMLPSLSKSPAELQSLGKVILGGVRNAISVGLGDQLEGTVADVLDASTMAAKYPFGAAVDEYAAIAAEGYVQVATQGRGLGIASIIGTQDYPGLKHASEIEAQQAVENATLKLYGKMDTGEATFQLLKQSVGEIDVAAAAGSEMVDGSTTWRDQGRSSFQRISRVDLIDLQRQIEGEFHAYFRGNLIRATVFYANPRLKKKDQLRINAMLPVRWPTEKEARDAAGQYGDAVRLLREWMAAGPSAASPMGPSEDFKVLASILGRSDAGGRERGAAAVAMWGVIASDSASRAGGGGGHGSKFQPEDGAAPARAEVESPQPTPAPVVDDPLDALDGWGGVAEAPAKAVPEVPPPTGPSTLEHNPLDDLDEIVDIASRSITDQGVKEVLEAASGTPDVVERTVEELAADVEYPKPPVPQVMRSEDAQELLAKVRARMLGA